MIPTSHLLSLRWNLSFIALTTALTPILTAADPDFSTDTEIREVLRQAVLLEAQNRLDAAKVAQSNTLKLQAELEASVATAEATAATQAKNAAEAQFGTRLTPLNGTVSTTSSAEAMIIVNHQIDQMADRIARDLLVSNRLHQGSSITLVPGNPDPTLQAGMRSYTTIVRELYLLEWQLRLALNEIPKLNEKSGTNAFAITGVGNIINAGLSMAALARVNRTYQGVEVKVEDMAFVTALAGHLIGKSALTEVKDKKTSATASSANGVIQSSVRPTPTNVIAKFLRIYSSGLVGGNEELTEKITKLGTTYSEGKVLLAQIEQKAKILLAESAKTDKKIGEVDAAIESLEKDMKVLQAAINHYTALVENGNRADTSGEAEKKGVVDAVPPAKVDPKLELAKARAEYDLAEGRKKIADTTKNGLTKTKETNDAAIKSYNEVIEPVKLNISVAMGKAEDILKAISTGVVAGIKIEDLMKAGMLKSRLGAFREEGDVTKDLVWHDYAGQYLTFVHVNSVAGTNLSRQTILTNSFRVAGGASVSYQVMKGDFSTVAAGTYYDHDGFYRVKDNVIGLLPSNIEELEEEEKAPSAMGKKGPLGPRSKT